MTRTWHIFTGEYPPQPGGVSDYTAQLAGGLAAAGDAIQVWAPACTGHTPDLAGVTVHRLRDHFSLRDLRRLGRALNEFPPPRRLLVQWVPHGFGWKSMNVPFCFWLLKRSVHRRDRIELMIHEAFVRFERSWKQRAAATVHRLMVVLLLRAATRVWHAIPLHESLLRPYTFGRDVPFTWLPIPSNIPVIDDAGGVAALRTRLAPRGEPIVGHFGTYGQLVAGILRPALIGVLRGAPTGTALLLGRGSDEFRKHLVTEYAELASRVVAPGQLESGDLSRYLHVCDVMLQPYADGISCRRTSAMAGLAHGRPVVTTSGAATEAFWAESGAAVIVPRDSALELIDATIRLLADEKRRQIVGAAAATLYHERFRLERIVAALRANRGTA